MVRDAGLEPANLSVLGPKPSAFANFASRARRLNLDYNITYPAGESTPESKKQGQPAVLPNVKG